MIDTIMPTIGACGLILLAALMVESARQWGHDNRLGDIPAGVLLGLVSVAQMFHPLEPFDGVIFDLRVIPLVLAGAFLNVPATLIAAGMAMCMQLTIGGTGMESGMAVALSAGLLGTLWQWASPKLSILPLTRFVLLGMFACGTMTFGRLLPVAIENWFYANAAPVLGMTYMIALPVLAWLMEQGLSVEHKNGMRRREALRLHGVFVLGLPTFARLMRIRAINDKSEQAHAMLSIKIDTGNVRRLNSGDILEALLLRVKTVRPDMSIACLVKPSMILLPLDKSEVPTVDLLAKRIRDVVRSKPVFVAGQEELWLTCEVAMVSPARLFQAKPQSSRKLGGWWLPARARRHQTRDMSVRELDTRFEPISRQSHLFQKANVLMTEPGWRDPATPRR